jgi:hypothetical protein
MKYNKGMQWDGLKAAPDSQRYPGEPQVVSKSEFYITVAMLFFCIGSNLPKDDQSARWVFGICTLLYLSKAVWEAWKAKCKSMTDTDAGTTDKK